MASDQSDLKVTEYSIKDPAIETLAILLYQEHRYRAKLNADNLVSWHGLREEDREEWRRQARGETPLAYEARRSQ